MSISLDHSKRLWNLIARRYGISLPVENKSKMFEDVLASYAEEVGEKQAAEDISRSTFIERFYDVIQRDEQPKLGPQKKSAIARLAGFVNWQDFLARGLEEETASPDVEESAVTLELENIFVTTGLTNAYPQREDALSDVLEDIRNAKSSIEMYARVYISELMKGTQFAPAVAKNLLKGSAFDDPLIIRHVSCDPEDQALSQKQYEAEDPEKRRWPTLQKYQDHLKWSNQAFEVQHKKLVEYLDLRGHLESDKRRKARLENVSITGSLLPFSLIVIDKKILYASIYALSAGRFGMFAPTMRMVVKEEEETCWANKFLIEGMKIDRYFSKQHKTYPEI